MILSVVAVLGGCCTVLSTCNVSEGAAVNDGKHSDYLCGSIWPIGNRYYSPNSQQRDIQTATMYQLYGRMHRRMDVCMKGMHGRF